MDENKRAFLEGLNTRIQEVIDELAAKHNIEVDDELYFAYGFGLWDGKNENHYTVNINCLDFNELEYILCAIEDEYASQNVDNLLDDIHLN